MFAIRDGKVVDQFIGALPEDAVEAFVGRLAPSEVDRLVADGVAAGDEEVLRQALELQPDHPGAITALATMLIGRVRPTRRSPSSAVSPRPRRSVGCWPRRVSHRRRSTSTGADVSLLLDGLLERVRDDTDARQEFLDLLETLGPDDPRTSDYRKALAARLF